MSTSSSSSMSASTSVPHCTIHSTPCYLHTSRSRNAVRYYACSQKPSCGFFAWEAEEERVMRNKDGGYRPHPACKEHERTCALKAVKKAGPNHGRPFFVCDGGTPDAEQKDGEYACKTFWWADTWKEQLKKGKEKRHESKTSESHIPSASASASTSTQSSSSSSSSSTSTSTSTSTSSSKAATEDETDALLNQMLSMTIHSSSTSSTSKAGSQTSASTFSPSRASSVPNSSSAAASTSSSTSTSTPTSSTSTSITSINRIPRKPKTDATATVISHTPAPPLVAASTSTATATSTNAARAPSPTPITPQPTTSTSTSTSISTSRPASASSASASTTSNAPIRSASQPRSMPSHTVTSPPLQRHVSEPVSTSIPEANEYSSLPTSVLAQQLHQQQSLLANTSLIRGLADGGTRIREKCVALQHAIDRRKLLKLDQLEEQHEREQEEKERQLHRIATKLLSMEESAALMAKAKKTPMSRTSSSTSTSASIGSTPVMSSSDVSQLYASLRASTIIPTTTVTPPTTLRARLMPHQMDALRWMVEREKRSESSTSTSTSVSTSTSTPAEDDFLRHVHGGILGDDCGLGKTVQMIALILYQQQQQQQHEHKCDSDDEPTFINGRIKSHTTLIICPRSVLHQWGSELELHVQPDTLRVHTYYGNKRNRDRKVLASCYDIILTTYSLVMNEFRSIDGVPKDGVGSVHWKRIVLDEAHTIRNPKTKTTQAICALEADNRWYMSATPMQNSLDDMYTCFKFLRFQPYQQLETWKKIVPDTGSKALKRLQTLLSIILLRRTKSDRRADGSMIIALPEKHMHLHTLGFNKTEQTFYDELWKQYQNAFAHMTPGQSSYSACLVMLLRLRQTCSWYGLTIQQGWEPAAKGTNEEQKPHLPIKRAAQRIGVLPPDPAPVATKPVEKKSADVEADEDDLVAQLNGLSVAKGEDSKSSEPGVCSICSDVWDEPVQTACQHVFCRDCIGQHLSQMSDDADPVCPTCQKPINESDLIPVDPSGLASSPFFTLSTPSRSYLTSTLSPTTSTKLTFLLSQLTLLRDRNASRTHAEMEKVVIFSQWTSMLTIIAQMLDQQDDMNYVELHGGMSAQQQTISLRAFNDQDEEENSRVMIILISLKAGGVGLNLTRANHVFLMDIWWNPFIEAQAFDRIYRVGQTRPVHIHRLLIKDTVEATIARLQQQKNELAQGIMPSQQDQEHGNKLGSGKKKSDKDGKKDKLQLTMADLQALFMSSQEQ